MKRILALLLSLAMLIGACGFAEEAAAGRAHRYALSDVVITYGESAIDFSSIDMSLEISEDGPALLARIDADGETAAEIGVTRAGGLDVLHVAGTLTGHKDFVVDPVFQTEKALKNGIDGLVGMLQSIDTRAVAQKLVNFFENPAPALEPEAPEEEPAEEPEVEESEDAAAGIGLSGISIEGDILAEIQKCVTTEEGVEMDGGNGVPAGIYHVERFDLDEETIAGMLDMVRQNGEPAGLGDQLRESGAVMAIDVAKYDAEGTGAIIADASIEAEGKVFDMHVAASKTAGEDGSVFSCDLTVNSDGTPAGLTFTLAESADAEASFTPDSVDIAGAVSLDEMSDDEALAELSETFDMLQADILIPFAGPVMVIMMQNVDLNQLQEAIDAAAAEMPEAE